MLPAAVMLVFTCLPAFCYGESPARITSGGIGRYMSDRWGMVKATVHNTETVEQDFLLLVTPPNGNGLQFGRKIRMPAGTSSEISFPVWISSGLEGNLDFPYLIFPGGDDDGVVTRRSADNEVVPSYNALVRASGRGMMAWLTSTSIPDEQNVRAQQLMFAMQHGQPSVSKTVVSLVPRELTGHAESLDAVSQLIVSSNELTEQPEVCEAIRLWVQRGGRLWLCLDQTGPESVEALLGDAFPFSVVGQTSANTIKLDINPDYRKDGYPVREVIREFDEPRSYIRVVADRGEMVWTVDGWPVAFRLPFGEGTVVVTTISPDVFYTERERKGSNESPVEFIPSMRRIQNSFFGPIEPPQLNAKLIAAQAASRIGYTIPSRWFAILLTLGFPTILLAAGLIVIKSHRGERLIWVTPLLAILMAIPAMQKGLQISGSAPPTSVQTQIINAVPGQIKLVSDGLATIYMPDSGNLAVTASRGSILAPPPGDIDRSYRRLIWNGKRTNEWKQLNRSVGLTTLQVRNTRLIPEPMDAVATFTEQGVEGRIQLAGLTNPRDALFAGTVSGIQSATVSEDGRFSITSRAFLAPGTFFESTLMTDEQRQHSSVYENIINPEGQAEAFPEEPAILYWANAEPSGVKIGGDDMRQEEQLLVVQPIRLEQPEIGKTFMIPPGFLSYRAVQNDDGNLSSAFDSARRRWNLEGSERDGIVRLQFEIPKVCRPFALQDGQLHIRLRAGSRTVQFSAGEPGAFQEISVLKSPVGSFDIDFNDESIQKSIRSGVLYLEISVSSLNVQDSGEESIGEQDDSWSIEELSMTLQGQRTNE
ncbi:MAG: hypothetical protein R3C20_04385 [Planctomycetaceae bacterium]